MPPGLLECVEALGLRTYGKELHNPSAVVRKPTFTHEAVLKLYKIELPALSLRLWRDGDTSLRRDDPNLFNAELDEILQRYGPQIWPKREKGTKRDHLREPKQGSVYPTELFYPRDQAVLKRLLRDLVLAKKVRSDWTDMETLVERIGEQRTRTVPAVSSQGPARRSHRGRAARPASTVSRKRSSSVEQSAFTESDSEEAAIGAQTRQKTSLKTLRDSIALARHQFCTELRLYRAPSLRHGQLYPLGSITLTHVCTAEECFSLVCKQIDSDCSWLTFRLPEDMAPTAQIRIDRGTRGSEAVFQRVLDIFKNARIFPGDPKRTVEVECGLDVAF